MVLMFELSKLSHELSISEILSLTFNLYLSNFSIFFIPFFIANLLSALMNLPILTYIQEIEKIDYTAPPDVVLNKILNILLMLLVFGFIIAIISWIIGNVVSGIIIKSASDIIEKQKTSLGDSLNFVISKLPSLLGASLIVGILTVLGFLIFVIPGIIVVIMFYLVIPTIVIEEKRAYASLYRSKELVNKRWLKTFVLLLILTLIIGGLTFAVNLILTPLGIYTSLASSLITSIIAPIYPISSIFYYYSMRAKEESEKILPPPPPPF